MYSLLLEPFSFQTPSEPRAGRQFEPGIQPMRVASYRDTGSVLT